MYVAMAIIRAETNTNVRVRIVGMLNRANN